MKPVTFEEANTVIGKDQPEYQPLPAYREGENPYRVVSCWELNDEEKEQLLNSGKLYLSLMTFGQAMQPILPTVFKEDLFKPKETEPVEFNSAEYWEKRYASGGNSGAGSSRQLAAFKGEFIGKFMYEHLVLSVIDWGCGDGAQIQYLQWNTTLPFPKYIGLDVSKTSIEKCKQFPFNPEYFKFMTTGEYNGEQAELGLSLDVIYHLVEDDVFERYMQRLCDSATKYLVIYSSDGGKVENPAQHLKERCFTEWIKEHRPEWELIRYVANVFPYRGGVTHEESISDFYIYKRTNSGNDLP